MEDKKRGDKKEKTSPEGWWQPAILMFARLSGWVIGPVIAGAVIGMWLDKKYNTEPWLFLASVGVAFIISMIGLIKNTIDEYKKINKNK